MFLNISNILALEPHVTNKDEFYKFDENILRYVNKSELNGPNWVLHGCTQGVLQVFSDIH